MLCWLFHWRATWSSTSQQADGLRWGRCLLGQRRRVPQLVGQCPPDPAQLVGGGGRHAHLRAGLLRWCIVVHRLPAGGPSVDGRIPLLQLLVWLSQRQRRRLSVARWRWCGHGGSSLQRRRPRLAGGKLLQQPPVLLHCLPEQALQRGLLTGRLCLPGLQGRCPRLGGQPAEWAGEPPLGWLQAGVPSEESQACKPSLCLHAWVTWLAPSAPARPAGRGGHTGEEGGGHRRRRARRSLQATQAGAGLCPAPHPQFLKRPAGAGGLHSGATGFRRRWWLRALLLAQPAAPWRDVSGLLRLPLASVDGGFALAPLHLAAGPCAW